MGLGLWLWPWNFCELWPKKLQVLLLCCCVVHGKHPWLSLMDSFKNHMNQNNMLHILYYVICYIYIYIGVLLFYTFYDKLHLDISALTVCKLRTCFCRYTVWNFLTKRNAGLTNFQHSLQYSPGLKPIIRSMSSLKRSTPGKSRTSLPLRPHPNTIYILLFNNLCNTFNCNLQALLCSP